MEEEFGVKLFSKKGRNIVLTEYGTHLKRRLDTLLPEIDRLPQELEQIKIQMRKTVKLNIFAASALVIHAIVDYRKLHPDVIFDFEQNKEKHDSDMVITTNGKSNMPNSTAVKRCVKKEQIYLAVPQNSPYAALKSIDLKMVRNEGFVMLSDSRLFGVICNKFCAKAGFYPKILFESDSPNAVQNIISTGNGVAFWPKYSWGTLKNENITLLRISNPDCQRELIIELHERLPQSEYAEDFYRFLINRLE